MERPEISKSVKNVATMWGIILTVTAMFASILALPDPWGVIGFMIPVVGAILVGLGLITKQLWEEGKG